MFVISQPTNNDVKSPVFIWLPVDQRISEERLSNDVPDWYEQIVNVSKLPFVFHHIALMPDCHQGFGVPIGSVLPTNGVIIPSAVGVDIGCGMGFTETDINVDDIRGVMTPNGPFLKAVIAGISREVPTGFKKHNEPRHMPTPPDFMGCIATFDKELTNAPYQLGTLGGGNHFIELQENEQGKLCIMLHSGSRHLGLTIAEFYNNEAKELNASWYSAVDPAWKLAFLPMDTAVGQEYFQAMNYALTYAQMNREIMMNVCVNVLTDIANRNDIRFNILNEINIHHNYAALEHHYGKDVYVHRKGAIRMREGELGIIPGSMGSASYIVEGKGSQESFCSASHGAGRAMSRTKARNTLVLAEQEDKMRDVVMLTKVSKVLDECPDAYKDIDTVISNESDLVRIVQKLKPLAVIKGDD